MRIEKIETVASPLMADIYNVYMSSFPVAERRPWESIIQMIESASPFFSLLAATDDRGKPVGFATVWRLPNALYIEHLAVDESSRSHGYGGEILDYIVDIAGESPTVVEVELPDSNADAPRRIAFYERHGFNAMTDLEYYQPPYAPELPDVQLMLMTTRELTDPMEFVIMLHTLVYNQ